MCGGVEGVGESPRESEADFPRGYCCEEEKGAWEVAPVAGERPAWAAAYSWTIMSLAERCSTSSVLPSKVRVTRVAA